jgi:indolepyruvate ferredoxin oxidoreductase beta subunit
MSQNILIVGVGGQGTLLASRILGALADKRGEDVKVSEVHGMAQRGGSVVTYVRMGTEIASPLIEAGGADFMLAFEQMEALRYLHLMKPGGVIIVNTQKILPVPVIMGAQVYPDDILDQLRAAPIRLVALNALAAAREAGSVRVVNTLMMGRLARFMGSPVQTWLDCIRECVPTKTIELN